MRVVRLSWWVSCRLSCLSSVLFVLVGSGFFSQARGGGTGEEPRHHPQLALFKDNELVEYRASWNGIPVASAQIRAGPTLIEGRKFYQVRIQAQTWRYLELLWKMRDSIESVFDPESLRPRRFVFRQRENRKRTDTTALFDAGSKRWTVRRQEGMKVLDYDFFSQNTFDPISAVYLARSLDFEVGDAPRLEVFGGKSRYLVTLSVEGRERVSLGSGDFDAYRIVPRVTNLAKSGYAKRVREATVWISADHRRMPLKMSSRVFIGSVNIEMVEKSV